MKILKITEENHQKLLNLSKSIGISMTKLINGLIAGCSDREMVRLFNQSILAAFDENVSKDIHIV